MFAVRRLHSRDNPERPPTVVLLEIAPDVAAEMERLVKAIPKMSEFLGYANVCISTNNHIIVSVRDFVRRYGFVDMCMCVCLIDCMSVCSGAI